MTSRKLFRTRRQSLIAAAVLISAAVAAVALVLPAYQQSRRSNDQTLKRCRQTDSFNCYGTYYAKLTYDNDPATAFKDFEAAYSTDSYVKSQCHQIAHVIGRTALKKYGTLAAAYTKGDNFCWSGYYHGVTEQAIADIGGAKIKAQASTICASLAAAHQYSFDHFNCVHGLGHGFMAVDGYNLFSALDSCKLLNDQWEKSSCYGGVFMENVMIEARGDGSSRYLKKSDPLYPCNAVVTEYKDQCYLMQTSYILQNNGYDFAATFKLCAQADEGFQTECYQSIGRDASGSTSSDIARTIANCNVTSDDASKRNCMVGASKDFVAYFHSDIQAKQLCGAFGAAIEPECLSTVAEFYATF